MMDNKLVAKHLIAFVGGHPTVSRFYNEDNQKSIDIVMSKDGFCHDTKTCSTIGFSGIDFGLKNGDKRISVEILAAGYPDNEQLENVLGTVAFEIMDSNTCAYGAIVPRVVGDYGYTGDMEHVLLLSPAYWNNYKPLDTDCETIVWLMAIPISDNEAEFIRVKGVDAFDSLLDEKKVDVLDYSRKTIL